MSPGKIILLVFGAMVLLGAVALLFGGGALVWIYHGPADGEGFASTKDIYIDRDTRAVITRPVDIDEDALTALNWIGLDTIKVEGSNDNLSKQIFMGIANEWDVRYYLRDVDIDEMTKFAHWLSFAGVTYERNPGAREPASPASESFWKAWTVSTPDERTPTLEWEPEAGRHTLVLMNDDGSAGVDLTVVLKVQIPGVVFALGISLLVGGMVSLAVGAVMVYFATRNPELS
jgi:hypothetical protein